MGIVLYRYFLVLKSSFVQTGARRRILSCTIFIWIMVTSVIMTCWAIYYEDYNYQYLGDKLKIKYIRLVNYARCSLHWKSTRVFLQFK